MLVDYSGNVLTHSMLTRAWAVWDSFRLHFRLGKAQVTARILPVSIMCIVLRNDSDTHWPFSIVVEGTLAVRQAQDVKVGGSGSPGPISQDKLGGFDVKCGTIHWKWQTAMALFAGGAHKLRISDL
jgi:hypothetical protein